MITVEKMIFEPDAENVKHFVQAQRYELKATPIEFPDQPSVPPNPPMRPHDFDSLDDRAKATQQIWDGKLKHPITPDNPIDLAQAFVPGQQSDCLDC